MSDRSELGEEKVGDPIWELQNAAQILCMTEFENVRSDAIEAYLETFLMSVLPGVIDEAISDEQLANLSPGTTSRVAFLLLAHFVHELRDRLAPKADPAWAETYIRRVADLIKIQGDPVVDRALRPQGLDDENDPLIKQFSAEMGVEVAKFFVLQPAMIEVVVEDVLSRKRR